MSVRLPGCITVKRRTPELTPLQRAGLLAGHRRARQRLSARVQRLDEELASLQNNVAALGDEYHRCKAIERGIGAERDVDAWLN